MTTQLEALALRVEAASGVDRELDALIACAVNDRCAAGAHKEMPSRNDAAEGSGYVLHCYAGGQSFQRARPFTASLDAAMTLIPAGWFTRMATEDRHSHSWRWDLRGGFGVEASARAATPALALTSAALKARAHSIRETPDA